LGEVGRTVEDRASLQLWDPSACGTLHKYRHYLINPEPKT